MEGTSDIPSDIVRHPEIVYFTGIIINFYTFHIFFRVSQPFTVRNVIPHVLFWINKMRIFLERHPEQGINMVMPVRYGFPIA
jgi:hypothetical protein